MKISLLKYVVLTPPYCGLSSTNPLQAFLVPTLRDLLYIKKVDAKNPEAISKPNFQQNSNLWGQSEKRVMHFVVVVHFFFMILLKKKVYGGVRSGGWGSERDESLQIPICSLMCVINVGAAAPAAHNYGFIPLRFSSSGGASDTGGL